MPNPLRLIRARLSNSCNVKELATFFEMFIGNKQFNILACYTNAYAQY
jgi:hypothetical protein